MKILGKSSFGKPIKVRIVGDADKAYAELVRIVGEETGKGIKSSENQTLLRGIQNAIDILRDNLHYGIQLPKKQIPKKYIELYDVRNLWIIDLPLYWRLVYTVNSTEVEVINLILDFYDHLGYDKVFHYKKK